MVFSHKHLKKLIHLKPQCKYIIIVLMMIFMSTNAGYACTAVIVWGTICVKSSIL